MIESQIVSYLCHYEVDELAKKIKIIFIMTKNNVIFVINLKN